MAAILHHKRITEVCVSGGEEAVCGLRIKKNSESTVESERETAFMVISRDWTMSSLNPVLLLEFYLCELNLSIIV